MNGRRRKDEPFNPFAPNAQQKARDRKKTTRPQQRPRTPEPKKTVDNLAAKQKAAMEALKKRREISEQEKSVVPKEKVRKPSHQPSPQPKPAPKTQIRRPDNREERLAALRAKSAATAQCKKQKMQRRLNQKKK